MPVYWIGLARYLGDTSIFAEKISTKKFHDIMLKEMRVFLKISKLQRNSAPSHSDLVRYTTILIRCHFCFKWSTMNKNTDYIYDGKEL